MKMKSPFTGGDVTLVSETRTATFRKENFGYTHLYYLCEDTKEQFTTTQMDVVNTNQVYNQYRLKYGIPFLDEIKQTRSKYGVSAAKMSAILGFGVNQYRLYENGEMPSIANGKVLNAIQSPAVFNEFVETARNVLTDAEYKRIKQHISTCEQNDDNNIIRELVFGNTARNSYNGFAAQSLSKLKNMMLFFIERLGGVFITQMNKLLFYSDFLSYRETGMGISGLSYVAIQRGPVPYRWDRVYSLIEDIRQEIIECANGNVGTKLVSNMPCDNASLTEEQITLLNDVYNTFKHDSPTQLSNKSHKERGWIDNEKGHSYIDYKYAFVLNAL